MDLQNQKLFEATKHCNQAPFMNKELSKVTMNISKLRSRYLKWPSRENYLLYKKIKSKCNTL